ncbi:type II secretion system protein GspG [Bacillus wiedmannii]|uniref:type II secretion system protein GspG n=1 Tax=Bacillus wiedmannii TaxID=1890302 RepID=UPI001C3F414A|nr:type II secretion system protein GspG [Bacillus wiedmannii]
MELTNSKRVLRSSSYVMIEQTPKEQEENDLKSGRALEKINFIRQVGMKPEQVKKVRENLSQENINISNAAHLAENFDNLSRIVDMLSNNQNSAATNITLAPLAASIPASLLVDVAALKGERDNQGNLSFLIEAFKKRMKTAPVGQLHLERIEMYPVGVERGELMYTVPLAPKETVTISHKEWATTSEEFERIVQDYFESYSERGVAEKTDVSISTENESKHASAFNFSAQVTGGYGPVSMTVTTGLNNNSENRQVVKDSTQRAREVTEKASARTRQEHKISFKLETKRGTEDNSFRTITNPHDDRAIRIDYYRMMRKWRTDLFRYGLRLTFDIVIPNPGARLWALHRRVRELDKEIQKPFVFPLKLTDLTEENDKWKIEADKYGGVIEPPPPKAIPLSISRSLQDPKGGMEIFEFVAPDGYKMKSQEVRFDGMWLGTDNLNVMFPPNTLVQPVPYTVTSVEKGGTFKGTSTGSGSGKQASWFLYYSKVNRVTINVVMGAIRDELTLEAWRIKSWTTLRDIAFAKWQDQIAKLQAERDRLWMELSGKDTLTLRRLEREELIRQTLYWIIGEHFDPTPSEVGKILNKLIDMEQNQLPDDFPNADSARKLTKDEWAITAGFGDIVKYLHHAIEWENLLYFLYPYFWGSDDLAREKMLFEHPDVNHRDFLRAGYTRIVIPVRPGFEESFTKLINTGVFSSQDKTPYITIAEEVANFARTNYASIPPANPEKHARPLLYPEQRKTWDTMQKVIKLIEDYYKAHKAYPANLSVLPGAPFKDAWNHNLVYKNPGSSNDYDLISLGANNKVGGEGLDADISAAATASLVASWFDYTPTSGIDIEIDSKFDKVD